MIIGFNVVPDEAARTMAEQMIDPEAKRTMISVAETYEQLARRAEAHQPKTQE